ncbi:hypothetical protein AVEN_106632-1 [Araneus ventricosus]|uniref:Uncharacterized protein n=1 Tax=Araneus ventricosus TaxID=182803 RepID=A0A4Y2KCS3_ARAVE|nr:hypothetical protein AVEN_106632-1 [Araneus ventricosus]
MIIIRLSMEKINVIEKLQMHSIVVAYLNSGKNISNASELKESLLYMGGVRNSKVSVIEINNSNTHYTFQIIQNISTYHSAEATDTGLKVWQYFGIDPGKDISLNEEAVLSSGYNVLSEFSSSQQHTLNTAFSVKPKRPRLDREYAANYFCSDQNCMSSFHTDSNFSNIITVDNITMKKLSLLMIKSNKVL